MVTKVTRYKKIKNTYEGFFNFKAIGGEKMIRIDDRFRFSEENGRFIGSNTFGSYTIIRKDNNCMERNI